MSPKINYSALLDALKFLIEKENIQAYEKIANIFVKSVQMALGQSRALSPKDQDNELVQAVVAKYRELSTQVTPVKKSSPSSSAPETPSQSIGKKFPAKDDPK